MQIVRVSTEQVRRSIPVKGWDSISKTLTAFANGCARGSRATEQLTLDEIGKGRAGAMGVGMFLLGSVMVGQRNLLVDRMLSEAKQGIAMYPQWHKSYDYDAMGTPFFKTSVTIKILDREADMYSIGLYAAYVGDKPEEGLAEYIGIPRTLLSCNVEVETQPLRGNRFEFDFEPVVSRLDSILKTKQVTGKQVAEAMLSKDASGEHNPIFVLQDDGEFETSIVPGRVERRTVYSSGGKSRDTWSVKGSVFSGELRRDYESDDEKVKATPTFVIIVAFSQKDHWNHSVPIWQPDRQQKAIDLANKIASTLQ